MMMTCQWHTTEKTGRTHSHIRVCFLSIGCLFSLVCSSGTVEVTTQKRLMAMQQYVGQQIIGTEYLLQSVSPLHASKIILKYEA